MSTSPDRSHVSVSCERRRAQESCTAAWADGLSFSRQSAVHRKRIEELRAAFAQQAVPQPLMPCASGGPQANAASSTGSEVQCSLPTQAKLLFKRSW